MEEGVERIEGGEEIFESMFKPRRIKIEPLNHGYVVWVGCHKFAFESLDYMLQLINDYYKDPGAIEAKWHNGELLSKNF